MKIGTVGDVIKGATIDHMGDNLDGDFKLFCTKDGEELVIVVHGAMENGLDVSVDAEWD